VMCVTPEDIAHASRSIETRRPPRGYLEQ